MTDVRDAMGALLEALTAFNDVVTRRGVTKTQCARFLAGLAAGASRHAGFTWEEFTEQAQRGWQASQSSGGDSS